MASDSLATGGQLLVATDRAWWRVRDVRYGALLLDVAAPVRCALGDCCTRHLTLLRNQRRLAQEPARPRRPRSMGRSATLRLRHWRRSPLCGYSCDPGGAPDRGKPVWQVVQRDDHGRRTGADPGRHNPPDAFGCLRPPATVLQQRLGVLAHRLAERPAHDWRSSLQLPWVPRPAAARRPDVG